MARKSWLAGSAAVFALTAMAANAQAGPVGDTARALVLAGMTGSNVEKVASRVCWSENGIRRCRSLNNAGVYGYQSPRRANGYRDQIETDPGVLSRRFDGLVARDGLPGPRRPRKWPPIKSSARAPRPLGAGGVPVWRLEVSRGRVRPAARAQAGLRACKPQHGQSARTICLLISGCMAQLGWQCAGLRFAKRLAMPAPHRG